MKSYEKRQLILKLKNNLKIRSYQLAELEKQCNELLQMKYRMQALQNLEANGAEELEREWFYESGRVKKDPPPKRRESSTDAYAKELGLSPAEASEAIVAFVANR